MLSRFGCPELFEDKATCKLQLLATREFPKKLTAVQRNRSGRFSSHADILGQADLSILGSKKMKKKILHSGANVSFRFGNFYKVMCIQQQLKMYLLSNFLKFWTK